MTYDIAWSKDPTDGFGWWGDFIGGRYFDTVDEALVAMEEFVASDDDYAAGYYGIVDTDTGNVVAGKSFPHEYARAGL